MKSDQKRPTTNYFFLLLVKCAKWRLSCNCRLKMIYTLYANRITRTTIVTTSGRLVYVGSLQLLSLSVSKIALLYSEIKTTFSRPIPLQMIAITKITKTKLTFSTNYSCLNFWHPWYWFTWLVITWKSVLKWKERFVFVQTFSETCLHHSATYA